MIKIAIATNKNFYEKTLPIIISSLLESGIEKKDIHVFNSGFDDYKMEIINEITYHFLNHNSYEYGPLIEICEKRIKSEYWFLIHDTCKVGLNFKKLLYNIPNKNTMKIALKSKPSMSIGLYNYNYLLSIEEKLLSIKKQPLEHYSGFAQGFMENKLGLPRKLAKVLLPIGKLLAYLFRSKVNGASICATFEKL